MLTNPQTALKWTYRETEEEQLAPQHVTYLTFVDDCDSCVGDTRPAYETDSEDVPFPDPEGQCELVFAWICKVLWKMSTLEFRH